MKLTYEMICSATFGMDRVCSDEGLISFHRFSEGEEELYRTERSDKYAQVFSPSGGRISFYTSSRSLSIKAECRASTSRRFFSIDIKVNGADAGSINNFGSQPQPLPYSAAYFESEPVQMSISLPEGEKLVDIYLPWSVKFTLLEMSLSDGATFRPAEKRRKTLVAYGDSITQGFDALYTSAKYTTVLADMLGAEEINKGIGGEIFCPSVAEHADYDEPDYITVAYGTNDWCGRQNVPLFYEQCREFFRILADKYPNSKIFAITPIWRKCEDKKPLGELCEFHSVMENLLKDIPSVIMVRGYDFVPHESKYFADLHLHPNDEGFALQAQGIFEQMKKHI